MLHLFITMLEYRKCLHPKTATSTSIDWLYCISEMVHTIWFKHCHTASTQPKNIYFQSNHSCQFCAQISLNTVAVICNIHQFNCRILLIHYFPFAICLSLIILNSLFLLPVLIVLAIESLNYCICTAIYLAKRNRNL